MTELADEASHWLIMVEEIEIYRFMRRELEYLGAVLEPEIANLTTKALRGDAELRTRYAKSHVIAYDYQYLSRASQLLCHLLAAESLWAIAGVNTTVEVFESYPFSRGVEEFTRIHEDAEVTWVGVSGAQIKSHVEWKDPAAEFEGVAQDIAQTVATGVSGQLAGPEDIVGKVEAAKTAEVVDVADGGAGLEQVGVVCFHPYWAAKIQRALEQCNVPVNSWYNPLTLRGDVRENVLCAPLRVVTLLHLLVNDQDSVAWRAWFGFGDYLGRSADFKAIREQAQAHNPQAKFATFACTTDWGIQVLDTLKDFKPLRGQELLSALWAFVCTDVDGLQEVAHASQALPAMLRPLLDCIASSTSETENFSFLIHPATTLSTTITSGTITRSVSSADF
ncbi:hypothetical protein, partial [uncultured Duncaniella sp.]|uniref:hypothetical protein n=1 Tax=uncultured Duncaniella sp. TaxID=2768039 RepID=UPI0027298E04